MIRNYNKDCHRHCKFLNIVGVRNIHYVKFIQTPYMKSSSSSLEWHISAHESFEDE